MSKSTPTKEDRENEAFRRAFQQHAAGHISGAIDEAILELLEPKFGDGFWVEDS
jgi:hypothetical protein